MSRIFSVALLLLSAALCRQAFAHILSGREYQIASTFDDIPNNTEAQKVCVVAIELTGPSADPEVCSKEQKSYELRVLASFRAAKAAVRDPEFTWLDYGAAANSQAPNDLSAEGAAQSACAVALSDGHFGTVERPFVPTHPPSCSNEMVSYGLRLLADYDCAVIAEDKLP